MTYSVVLTSIDSFLNPCEIFIKKLFCRLHKVSEGCQMNGTIDEVLECINTSNVILEHEHKLLLQLDTRKPIQDALESIAKDFVGYLSSTGYGQHELKMPQRETTYPHAFLVQGKESNFMLGVMFDSETKDPEQHVYVCQASNFGNKNILKDYISRLKSDSPGNLPDKQERLSA